MQQIPALVVALSLLVVAACAGSAPAASPEPAAASATDGGHGGHGGHGGGHGAHSDFPACAVLAKACHAHDKDSEKTHACHVLGHSAPSNEECEAKRAECLAICGGGDGGV